MKQLESPTRAFEALYHKIRREWKIAFLTCFLLGLLVHMPILTADIPNHDGLDSMYFDQNMITSGRWFLTVACGISSYYTLPWLIGILGLLYLGCAAAALCELLEIRRPRPAAGCFPHSLPWRPPMPMCSLWTAICWPFFWRCWPCCL